MKGDCSLLTVKGLLLLLVSSWAFANMLARAFVLGDSRISGALLTETEFFKKVGFGAVEMPLPDRLSKTGFFACRGGPEDTVGCRGGLVRTRGEEELSSVPLVPPAWKRAMMAFTSALLS